MIDLRRELETDLDRFAAPDQWSEIEARASASAWMGTGPIPPGTSGYRTPRLVTASVAFAVFLAAAVVLWTAFRLEPDRPAAPSCPAGTWQAPVPSHSGLVITDVAASSARNVWVLGVPIGSPRSTLLHLENVRWSEVSSPGRHLRAISIVAPDDVWVLGDQQVWRSEGQSWSRMPLPVAATATATALGMVSRDDAYVAVVDGAGDLPTSIVLHWDGTDWTPVELPPSGSSDAAITSVEASGPNDVWAVGHRIEPAGTFSPLALHWDGTAWTDTEVPQIGPDAAFVDVTTMGPSDAWARITTAMQGGSPDTHLLRWDGGSWSDDRKHGGDERFSDLASGPSGTWLFTSNRSRFLQRWSGAAWGSTPRLPVDERLTGSMLWHRTSIASVGTGVVVVRMGADGVTAFAYTCG